MINVRILILFFDVAKASCFPFFKRLKPTAMQMQLQNLKKNAYSEQWIRKKLGYKFIASDFLLPATLVAGRVKSKKRL